MTIVKQIREVMNQKGISQAELAGLLGMAPSQLSAILNADPEYNFTVKMLRRFAAALGVPLTIAFDAPLSDLASESFRAVTGDVYSGGVITITGGTMPIVR